MPRGSSEPSLLQCLESSGSVPLSLVKPASAAMPNKWQARGHAQQAAGPSCVQQKQISFSGTASFKTKWLRPYTPSGRAELQLSLHTILSLTDPLLRLRRDIPPELLPH